MNFDDAFKIIIDDEHEGSVYTNNPDDPGGETKFGISKRAFPDVDIKNLNPETAAAIYKEHYWDKMRCGNLGFLAFDLFDFGVNAGCSRSIKTLQYLVGVDPDGIIGPNTIRATADQIGFGMDGLSDIRDLKTKFNASRIKYYTSLPTFKKFGKGWMNRIAVNMMKGY